MSNKVSIILPNKEFMTDLYYWLFEDEVQESAKWNGPYYARPTTELTKEEYVNKPLAIKYVYQGIPKSMYIIHEGQFLGTLHANWVSEETNWMEIGICIYNPDYWSGGYGTSAFQQWVDYIFNNSDLHRIGISTWSGNVRMMKLAEKVGMMEEARIRDARIVDGKYYDAIKMGMLRSEWEVQNDHKTCDN